MKEAGGGEEKTNRVNEERKVARKGLTNIIENTFTFD
jgi:hypothetical protein